jgi:hypothetical protein
VQLIIDGINSIRNGIFFILQLNEFLEKQFINECRYEVFYLYKQSLVHITRLKERLDEQDTFTEADNVDFAGIDAAGWKAYYADERYYYCASLDQVSYARTLPTREVYCINSTLTISTTSTTTHRLTTQTNYRVYSRYISSLSLDD